MKYYNILMIVSVILTFFSCSDDQGNYDYIDINRVEFDIDKMEKKYSKISYKDTLTINPILKNEKDDSVLEYLWTIFPEKESDNFDKVDTISTDRNLKYPVELSTGKYIIQHKIFDTSNGNIMTSISFELYASTSFSEGFYVLKETADGNTDLDLFTSNTDEFRNLLTKSTGSSLKGKPVSFGLYPTSYYLDKESGEILISSFLMPVSEDDFAKLRLDDLKKVYSFSEMFYTGDPGEKPLFFYSGMFYIGCVTDSNHYQNYQVVPWIEGSGSFGLPDEILYDDKGYVLHESSFIGQMNSVFFDTKNGRFIKCDFNGGLSVPNDAGDKFKCTKIEDELVFFGADKGGDDGYAIFKDKINGDKKMYYLSNLNNGNPVDTVFTIAPELKINSADIFLVSKMSEKMLYYVSDNKIYSYSSITEKESVLNFIDLPADEEITYLENVYATFSVEEESFNYLAVGTYKAGEYSIYLYKTLGGKPIDGAVRVLKGKGKAAQLQYVHPELTNSNRGKFALMY